MMNYNHKLITCLCLIALCLSSILDTKAQSNGATAFNSIKVNDSAPLTMKLSDALKIFKEKYGFDILYLNKVVDGITVSTDFLNSKENGETVLIELLHSVGLRCKKKKANLYAVEVGNRKIMSGTKEILPATENIIVTKTGNKEIEIKPTEKEKLRNDLPINIIKADIVISGVVKDEKGLPMEGALVTEKGTDNKVLTNKKGEFKLKVKDKKSVVVISFVGYNDQLLLVNNKVIFNITLNQNANTLEQVVVIGYGTVKKGDLTGSVVKVTGIENQEQPNTSVEQMLQGRVAGVQITQNTGSPGGGMTFNIRGANSISGSNQPLVVIDGYPVETGNSSPTVGLESTGAGIPGGNALANINPNDIESIEILKDASSTAIYGSRGANGVVIITTKRGKAGKDKIDYSYRSDFSTIRKKIDVLNTNEYIAYSNEAFSDQANGSLAYSQGDINRLKGINTDWQNLIYQKGITNSHQLTISGGEDRLKYAVSSGYLEQQGIVKNTKFRRGSIRINLDRKINDKLSIGLNTNGSLSIFNSVNQSTGSSLTDGSVVTGALRTPPFVVPFTQDGSVNLASGFQNPLTLINDASDKTKILQFNVTGFADYKIINDLKLSFRTGLNSSSSLRNYYMPRGTFIGDNRNGYGYQGNVIATSYLNECTLNYNKTIKRHRFNSVFGYTWQSWQDRGVGISGGGFPNDKLTYYNLNSASLIDKPVNNVTESSLASWIGRVNYVFNDKYLLTVSARYDGSTRLADGYKWSLFPSIAAGWNLHKEKIIRSLSNSISELKLRASYGVSGNQSVAVGSTKSKYNTSTAVIGQAVTTVYYPGNMPNDLLGWERTKQYNVGIDMGLMKGRLKFTSDIYKKRTENLLINLPIPFSTGYNFYTTNAGIVENIGIEFSSSYQIIKSGSFKWTVGGNLSFNKNKVVSLPSTLPTILGPTIGFVNSQNVNVATEGEPIGAFFGFKVVGIYQTQDEINKHAVDPSNPRSGDFKFADLNGDTLISALDRTILGSPYPKYFFGFTNDFAWKNISLNFLIQGSIGQSVANTNRFGLDGLSRSNNINVSREAYQNRWTGPGTSNKYPAARSLNIPFQGRFTDFIVEDASFVRLKNITLGYNLQFKKIKFINSCKFFVTATNLLTWTEYTGYDPEINSYGSNSLAQGIDNGSIPQFRTFSIGLTTGF